MFRHVGMCVYMFLFMLECVHACMRTCVCVCVCVCSVSFCMYNLAWFHVCNNTCTLNLAVFQSLSLFVCCVWVSVCMCVWLVMLCWYFLQRFPVQQGCAVMLCWCCMVFNSVSQGNRDVQSCYVGDMVFNSVSQGSRFGAAMTGHIMLVGYYLQRFPVHQDRCGHDWSCYVGAACFSTAFPRATGSVRSWVVM